ncbi:MAG: NADH-quinone oxidoreductase subunit L [Acidobacteriota bacterium]
MLDLLWIVPALPFLGFLILATTGARMPRKTAAVIGVASVGLSALLTILIGINFISSPPEGRVYLQTLWEWINVAGLNPAIALRLDAVSMTFIFVITFVGFLIHLYSVEYMEGEEGFSRFFAYMNLFVGSMLMLVLGDNLVLLYLGWEGVGLCSYLLIGFWYKDPYNDYAARKAFIVTRVGDTSMSIGLFILFTELGTLNIGRILEQAPLNWAVGSSLPVMTAALLLGGAVGKSAQLPLQTWLPDAMAGPTPVSALIHAATMVTAGVYLIARMHVIFTLAPVVLTIVGVVGALTLLLAGCSALAQSDIKRVLAYSTISQIGYMFLALGVGAWSAAIFHFMIHAFFKALLFLGSGVIILALHHEQNMFKMGGVRKMLPVTFWTFIIGSASLVALPLVTAGFYSKDLILFYAFEGDRPNHWLYAAGLLGAFITALYTTRMVVVTFFGEAKTHLHRKPTWIMEVPLIVLAFFSIFGGFIELPHTLGHLTLFSDFIQTILPANAPAEGGGISTELILQVVAAVTVILGIFIAYLLYYKYYEKVSSFRWSSFGNALHEYWKSDWGFDWLYDRLFVIPLVWIARINKGDFIDLIYTFIAWINRVFNRAFSFTQSGRVRWYAMGIALGAIITLTIAVFL